MDPHPRLILLQTTQGQWSGPCSALFCLEGGSALDAEVAIIGPAHDIAPGFDGYWTQEAGTLKSLRRAQPEAQLVGLAEDRHSAMTLGEAGADLILFGSFTPPATGDLALARWWAELFVVPCACIVGPEADLGIFGRPGQPEFYLQLAESRA